MPIAGQRLLQYFLPPIPVLVVEKDWLAAIATQDDMVKATRQMKPRLSRHQLLSWSRRSREEKRRIGLNRERDQLLLQTISYGVTTGTLFLCYSKQGMSQSRYLIMPKSKSWRHVVMCLSWIAIFASKSSVASDEPKPVSLVELISNSQQYVSQKIITTGFLRHRLNWYLFLTADHARISDFESAIRVSETDNGDIYMSGCGGSYVSIVGTFSESFDPGKYIIVDVVAILDPIKREVCWEQK